jgi:hypothetical protein
MSTIKATFLSISIISINIGTFFSLSDQLDAMTGWKNYLSKRFKKMYMTI